MQCILHKLFKMKITIVKGVSHVQIYRHTCLCKSGSFKHGMSFLQAVCLISVLFDNLDCRHSCLTDFKQGCGSSFLSYLHDLGLSVIGWSV